MCKCVWVFSAGHSLVMRSTRAWVPVWQKALKGHQLIAVLWWSPTNSTVTWEKRWEGVKTIMKKKWLYSTSIYYCYAVHIIIVSNWITLADNERQSHSSECAMCPFTMFPNMYSSPLESVNGIRPVRLCCCKEKWHRLIIIIFCLNLATCPYIKKVRTPTAHMSASVPNSLSSKTSGPVIGGRKCSHKLRSFTCKLWLLCAGCGKEFFTVEYSMTVCEKLERDVVTFHTYVHPVRLERANCW